MNSPCNPHIYPVPQFLCYVSEQKCAPQDIVLGQKGTQQYCQRRYAPVNPEGQLLSPWPGQSVQWVPCPGALSTPQPPPNPAPSQCCPHVSFEGELLR